MDWVTFIIIWLFQSAVRVLVAILRHILVFDSLVIATFAGMWLYMEYGWGLVAAWVIGIVIFFAMVALSTKKVTKVSLLGIWNYIKGKFGGSMVSPVVDSTRISGLDSSQSNIHSYFSASDLWDYIVTKVTQTITASATHLQIPSAKAVLDFVQARRRYQHTLVRYNNDSKQYPMGWIILITNNSTETYASFAKWLYDNNYRTPEASYWHCGGCCGTTGVRNQQDTGTAYIGRVVSGAYSTDGTSMMFKYDYNGTVSITEARTTVYSEPFLKPLS